MILVILALLVLAGCAATNSEQPAKARLTDVEVVQRIHLSGPNWKWEPQWVKDDHEGQRVHLVVLTPSQIDQVCGESAIACTISEVTQPWVPIINADLILQGASEEQFVEAGSCVIFMPVRDPEYPRTWFYLLGHEFAHCRYGQFHPDDLPVGDDV